MSEHYHSGRHDGVQVQIRKFILDQFPVARQRAPQDDDALLESGIVDSLGILEIVNFVTVTFGIAVSDDDLRPENFNSIRSLAEFVDRKRAGQ